MADYFEIDFLDVESSKGGDAITARYRTNGEEYIHIVDGGYQDTGDKIIEHLDKYYNNPRHIDCVVLTHQDNDHSGGLRKVLEHFSVGELWMLRPWLYADELINRFKRYSSIENLSNKLKEIYPNISALEEIANEKGIQIKEPFQGSRIGAFTVLSPSKPTYLDLVVQSEKTPEAFVEDDASRTFSGSIKEGIRYLRALWGQEIFPETGTSPENEMSIIQFAYLNKKRILLTGDAGRQALSNAAAFAKSKGLTLPGIDRFQVPHHGSRHNVNTEILDIWLGGRTRQPIESNHNEPTAIISASSKDENHPRKVVVRAFIHRGCKVVQTKGQDLRTQDNAPERAGWVSVKPLDYPEDQEE